MSTKRVIIRDDDDARAYLAGRGILPTLEIVDGRVVIPDPCGRCGGSGNTGHFRDGGVCYDCGGAITRNRVRRMSLKAYARDARKQETAARRKQAAAEERYQAKLERQRDWCEANGHGRITFDELDVKREAQRKAEAAKSYHLGTVGERRTFVLEHVHTATWDSYGGIVKLYIFRDVETGQSVTWKTSSWIELPRSVVWDPGTPDEWRQETSRSVMPGDVVEIKATVKEHGEYRGAAQTQVARAKVTRVWAESTKADPRKDGPICNEGCIVVAAA